jgi:hypothetical protein
MKYLYLISSALLLSACQLTEQQASKYEAFEGFEESANHPALVDNQPHTTTEQHPKSEILSKESSQQGQGESAANSFEGFEESANHPALVDNSPQQLVVEHSESEVSSKASGQQRQGESAANSFEGFEESANHPALIDSQQTKANKQQSQPANNRLIEIRSKTAQGEAEFTYQGTRLFTVQWRQYKAYFYTLKNSAGELLVHNPPLLYNIEKDPSELTNIAPRATETLTELKRLIAEQQQLLNQLSHQDAVAQN